MLQARDAISIVAAYNLVYYVMARRALKMTLQQSGATDARLSVGMTTSLGIIDMIFDAGLPRKEHSAQLKLLLLLSRCMLAFAPFAVIIVILLSW